MALDDKLKEMLVHVGYEWWMFRATFEQLKTISDTGDVVRNALIESLAIHGRGLILFFYDSGAKRPGDVTCDAYGVPREVLPKTGHLVDWKTDADKRIAHVTETRLDELKAWHTGDVYDALAPKIEALRALVRADLPLRGDPPRWIGDDTPTTIHSLMRQDALAHRGAASSRAFDSGFTSGTSSGLPGIMSSDDVTATTIAHAIDGKVIGTPATSSVPEDLADVFSRIGKPSK